MGSADLKVDYFRKAAEANARRRAIFTESGDPLGLVIGRLRDAWGLEVGLASDNRMEYFAGLVRNIPLAQLHRDWAPADARDWSIGGIEAQLTWNIYLQLGERGGAVVIYRRLYDERDDEQKMAANNCAYHSCAVTGCELVEIVPSLGELLLFNSRNYHKVERTDGGAERITASSFIGLTPDRTLVLWS